MFLTTFVTDPEVLYFIACLERKSKALKYDIEALDNNQGIFSVKGPKDKVHRVSFGVETDDGKPFCTCADGQQWHITSLQYSTCKVDGHGIG